MLPTLHVKRAGAHASLPVRGSRHAAGLDLHAALDAPVVVEPGSRALISTGLSMAFPEGSYGEIKSRSGLALRHGVVVQGGIIDGDYRGVVQVLLFNLGSAPFEVKNGDRIAQMLVLPVVMAQPAWVGDDEELPAVAGDAAAVALTAGDRGARGFGSTGVS